MSKPTKKDAALWQTAREQGLDLLKIAQHANRPESTIRNHTLMLNKGKQVVSKESLRTTRELLNKTRQPSHNVRNIILGLVGASLFFGLFGTALGALLMMRFEGNVTTEAIRLGRMFVFVPVLLLGVMALLTGAQGISVKLYCLIRYRKKIAALKAITKDKVVPSFRKCCFDPVYATHNITSQ